MSISVLTFTYIWKGPSNFVGTGGDQFKMDLEKQNLAAKWECALGAEVLEDAGESGQGLGEGRVTTTPPLPPLQH